MQFVAGTCLTNMRWRRIDKTSSTACVQMESALVGRKIYGRAQHDAQQQSVEANPDLTKCMEYLKV